MLTLRVQRYAELMQRANGSRYQSPLHKRFHLTVSSVENLKRRIAGLQPIEAPTVPLPTDTEEEKQGHSDADTAKAATSDETDDDSDAEIEAPTFIPEHCLFCWDKSETFDDNVAHMERSHGFHVRDQDRLVVDIETLIRYLHLVIVGYRECLYCQSKRRTVQAVRQHMREKGHCRFDTEDPTSEYRDFFDLEGKADQTDAVCLIPDSDSGDVARLPSGRLVSNRTAAPTSQGHRSRRSTDKSLIDSEPGQPPTMNVEADTSPGLPPSQALLRKEKREESLAVQLAQLSVNDRASIAHLEPSEQRAFLATQKKQMDRERRAEQRYASRVEMLGNKTLMMTFKNDVPGRTNG